MVFDWFASGVKTGVMTLFDMKFEPSQAAAPTATPKAPTVGPCFSQIFESTELKSDASPVD
jgi:hypothetical protein